MVDTPDWSEPTPNTSDIITASTLANLANFQADITQYQSVVVRFRGQNVNTHLRNVIFFYTDSTETAQVASMVTTCVEDPTGLSSMATEIPFYGAWMHIVNNSPQVENITVIGSSRPAPVVRHLLDSDTGYSYAVAAAFAVGVAQRLLSSGGALDVYPSNGQCWIAAGVNTTGSLQCLYRDLSGALAIFEFFNFGAGVTQFKGFVALPRGFVAFQFVPSAVNAAGTALMFINPAQL